MSDGSIGNSQTPFHDMSRVVPVSFAGSVASETQASPTGDESQRRDEPAGSRADGEEKVPSEPTGSEAAEPVLRPRRRGVRGCLAGVVTFLHSVLLAFSCGVAGKTELELQETEWWSWLWTTAEVPAAVAEEGRAGSTAGGDTWRACDPSAPPRSGGTEQFSGAAAPSQTDELADPRSVREESHVSRSDEHVQRLVVTDESGTQFVVEREEQQQLFEGLKAQLDRYAAKAAAASESLTAKDTARNTDPGSGPSNRKSIIIVKK